MPQNANTKIEVKKIEKADKSCQAAFNNPSVVDEIFLPTMSGQRLAEGSNL